MKFTNASLFSKTKSFFHFMKHKFIQKNMSLKVVPHSQFGISHSLRNNTKNLGFSCKHLRVNGTTLRKWGCLSAKLPQSKPHVEDDKPLKLSDLNSLPKPLSSMALVSSKPDGLKFRIAYKGAPGAYSEAAALEAYPKCETVPCEDVESAFKAVELWLVDKAILPIENSVAGSVHRNYDLFLRHRLHIIGEVKLIVDHCLLGMPGVQKEDLKHVLSHPQAFDQCKMKLTELDVVKVTSDDTAGPAQIVASKGLRDIGAIASSRAAEIYGLDILSNNIQDDLNNVTRFLILAREPLIPEPTNPISIVFTLEEGPGVLFKALAVFSLRNINLSKIESRPQKERPLRIVDDINKGTAKYFDYFFYIDFEASMAEPRAQYALRHLKEFSRFLRSLVAIQYIQPYR